MNDKILEDIKKRLECLILLNCVDKEYDKEKLRVAVGCLGLRETARLLGKDSGNLHRAINGKSNKNFKSKKEEADNNVETE